MKKRKPLIAELQWNPVNRYAAEEYLLKGVPGLQLSHYCIHHTHHNMQSCSTPRWMYENVSLAFRSDPNCFDQLKNPPNPTKDPKSWCHHDKLPIV